MPLVIEIDKEVVADDSATLDVVEFVLVVVVIEVAGGDDDAVLFELGLEVEGKEEGVVSPKEVWCVADVDVSVLDANALADVNQTV